MINSYSFGSIKVNGKKFTRDLIIYPDKITLKWRRKEGHLLSECDIREVLEFRPEVLIAGTGAYGLMKVDNTLKEKLRNLGIEIIAIKTAGAVEKYNKIYKDKKVVCALHLTC
ncbi:MAG: MTH938/NDUFAF3 family protein [Actinomycetota bacterium]|nr:MTH938/NDUFAF3 family protein [Actinomycetota bacterium]